MAIGVDDILGPKVRTNVPPIDSSLKGAPSTMPGSGAGVTDKEINGTPVQTATIPQGISSEIKGAPSAGQTVSHVDNQTQDRKITKTPAVTTIPTNVADKPTAANFVGGAPRSYEDLFVKFNTYKPKTQEEIDAEDRKAKRQKNFAAISDGIAALSNLYFTSQYAPNSYDPRQSMSERTRQRWDKIIAERDGKQREYYEGLLRARKMDENNAREERNWTHTIEREKIADHYRDAADTRAQAKADRDSALAQLRVDMLQGKLNEQQAAAEAKRIEADYAEAYWQSRINKNNYRRPIGSGGRSGEYPWYDADGNKHYAHSYEAMRQNAIDNGTWNEETQESSTQRIQADRKGKTKNTATTTTTKPAKGHSSKPDKKKPNPMGEVNTTGKEESKKKPNPMS